MAAKARAIQDHRDALLRRRIKFVVEKGAMARLFKRGSHKKLQEALFDRLQPESIASLRTPLEYDEWLMRLVRRPVWERFSRNGLKADRWAYFAKLINIIIYEVVSNRELFKERDWRRTRSWLHVPLDSYVLKAASHACPELGLARLTRLKGMTQRDYMRIQLALRDGAHRLGRPAIWFEDAWTPRS